MFPYIISYTLYILSQSKSSTTYTCTSNSSIYSARALRDLICDISIMLASIRLYSLAFLLLTSVFKLATN
jgi:hypothetical protein